MEELAEFNLLWIEEPTSPDDIAGHAAVGKALQKHGKKNLHKNKCSFRLTFFMSNNDKQE